MASGRKKKASASTKKASSAEPPARQEPPAREEAPARKDRPAPKDAPAIAFAWSADEKRVALGFEGGNVTLHDVDPKTGGPVEGGAPPVVIDWVARNPANVALVAFRGDGSVVVVTDDTGWGVCDGRTGEALRTASGETLAGCVDGRSLKDRPAQATLSPSGDVLFIARNVDGATTVHRVDLKTATIFAAKEVDARAPTSRLVALDDSVALAEFDHDDRDGKTREQGFVRVDFPALKVERTPFAQVGWPSETLYRPPGVLDVDVARGVGLRPDFSPMEPVDMDGQKIWPVWVEFFDLKTLEVVERGAVAGMPDASLALEGAEGLRAEPGSADHRAASELLLNHIKCARFVPATGQVWVGLKYGRAKRLDIRDDDAEEPMIQHRLAEGATDYPALEKRLGTRVIGVSPSGKYLAFGYPNDFRVVGS